MNRVAPMVVVNVEDFPAMVMDAALADEMEDFTDEDIRRPETAFLELTAASPREFSQKRAAVFFRMSRAKPEATDRSRHAVGDVKARAAIIGDATV